MAAKASKADKARARQQLQDARDAVAPLVKLGTNRPMVEAYLDRAEEYIEKGDVQRAQAAIGRARTTAIDSTLGFITEFIVEVRNALLLARTHGADVGRARPVLIMAQKALQRKEFRKSVGHCFEAVYTLRDVPKRYMDTLLVLMKARYDVTLAESIGLDISPFEIDLDLGFKALASKDYERAERKAHISRSRARELMVDYGKALKALTKAREVVGSGKRMGADVGEAEELLEEGLHRIEASDMRGAIIVLGKAIDSGIEAGKQMVFRKSRGKA